jgi:hypothetical protein
MKHFLADTYHGAASETFLHLTQIWCWYVKYFLQQAQIWELHMKHFLADMDCDIKSETFL